MKQEGSKKIIQIDYCLTRDAVLVRFNEYIPNLRGPKGKVLEKTLRKIMIDKGIQIMNWTPLIFLEKLPKVEGSFSVDITNIVTPQWKILKSKFQELNK